MATAQTVIDNSIVRRMDPDETTWTDAGLLVYLNKGYDYVHQLLITRRDELALKTASSFNITDGTETYSITDNIGSDFLAMYEGAKLDETGVWITDTFLDPCRETERVNYYNSDESEPVKYYLTGTTIGFLPVPDTTYAVTCKYYFQRSALTLTSTMPYTSLFDEALSTFMSNMALMEKGYDTNGIIGIYNELEKQALTIAGKRTPIKPRLRNRKR